MTLSIRMIRQATWLGHASRLIILRRFDNILDNESFPGLPYHRMAQHVFLTAQPRQACATPLSRT